MHAPSMRRLIEKKKRGASLTTDEWGWIVDGFTSGQIPEYQMSALLMAVWFKGMTFDETLALTRKMKQSGASLDLSEISRPTADKHSTGGVGDKVSLALAPLAASCGVAVPMVSGRGLGHTGGTLDKLVSIPGFRVHLPPEQFLRQVERIGCAIIGQSEGMTPADGKIYALRDVTATVDCNPLIAASIMSKKLAAGPAAIVMDVKIGSGAFMQTLEQGEHLAQLLITIGEMEGRRVSVLLTGMDQPLGLAVGNALEVVEVVELLKNRGPSDLRTVTLALAAEMIQLSGISDTLRTAWMLAEEKLISGQARSVFAEMVASQGGNAEIVEDPEPLLPSAPIVIECPAVREGCITQYDARIVGEVAVALGAGRRRIDEEVDPAVGVVLTCKVGQTVSVGDPVAFIYAQNEDDAAVAREELSKAVVISDRAQPESPELILGRMDRFGSRPWCAPGGE